MRRAGLASSVVLAAAAATGTPLVAQDCSLAEPTACGVTASVVRPALEEMFDRAFATGATLPALLDLLDDSVRIGELSLKFKTFQVDGSGESALGFGYDWRKSVSRSRVPTESPDLTRFDLALSATGNVAVDAATNPRDFLQSKASLTWLRSTGGVARESTPEEALELIGIVQQLAQIETFAELRTHPLHRQALAAIQGRLSTQMVLSAEGQVALESDQRFETRQWAYGGTFGLELHAWNPGSSLAQLNVFDWPFAVLRFLTGTDDEIRPRGSALPSFRLSLHQVSPQEHAQREALGEEGVYTRLSLEAGYRTFAGMLGSRSLHFEANARLYRELAASPAVEAAGLDRHTYVVAAITTSDGLFVSYSTGQLPFDGLSDQVYEIGFRYAF